MRKDGANDCDIDFSDLELLHSLLGCSCMDCRMIFVGGMKFCVFHDFDQSPEKHDGWAFIEFGDPTKSIPLYGNAIITGYQYDRPRSLNDLEIGVLWDSVRYVHRTAGVKREVRDVYCINADRTPTDRITAVRVESED